MTGPDRDSAAVAAAGANYAAQFEAMVSGDTALLDPLLTDDFVLTHMTGYTQPKTAWLADIDQHRMRYNAIDTVDIAIAMAGGHPELTARTLTEATIAGSHGTWRLQLRPDVRTIPGRLARRPHRRLDLVTAPHNPVGCRAG